MKLQPDQIRKALSKLRKQLNAIPPDPRPEAVHDLRTHTRRVEAAIAAVALEQEKKARRLLKLIKPVRRAAGQVRDMDVMIGDVLTLCGNQVSEPAVRLVQHLAQMRGRNARRLHQLVGRQRREIRDHLKQSSKLIRKKMKDDGSDLEGGSPPQILITELIHWPGLNVANLHLFRIRIKELRYMLLLNEQVDAQFVDALGEAKDTIGEWHDWLELERIAHKVLDPKMDGDLLKRIEQTGREKLRIALAMANSVRDRYLKIPHGPRTSRKILQMAS